MIEIVLRRPGGMVRMRVVEPEQIGSLPGGLPFRFEVVLGPHAKATPGPFFRGVGKRVRGRDHAVPADQRAAAFVGIRRRAMFPDCGGHT